KATGSGDDSLGKGTKESTAVPNVVSGSIPNNKSDLLRFYVSSDMVNGDSILYLGWVRANTLGNANMDFEFNQSTTISKNGVTPVRTAGDILITYDFGGSGTPDLGLLTWLTTGSSGACFGSSSPPCWGSRMDLTDAGFADGAV